MLLYEPINRFNLIHHCVHAHTHTHTHTYTYTHTHTHTVRAKKRGASDVKWLKTVLSSGTLSDKIATLTLLIQVRQWLVLH